MADRRAPTNRRATAAWSTSGSAASTWSTGTDQLVDATVQHLWITAAAVRRSGVVLAFPLALLARRHPRLETGIVGGATGLYTIPSLALFPLLVPFTGITATTVVIGLALYSLTILVRAILDGLRCGARRRRRVGRRAGVRLVRAAAARSSCRSRCR